MLNVGETTIPGADRRPDQLRERGCAIRIPTNAASSDHSGAIAKFKRLAVRVDDEIITSREATLQALGRGHWGVLTATTDPFGDQPNTVTGLCDAPNDYHAVEQFLFLSSTEWIASSQELLVKAMQDLSRPIIIESADLTAPRNDGFSIELGYFGQQVADLTADRIQFVGKPFPKVYGILKGSLTSLSSDRIAMCGDTLHTDILGAVAGALQL